MITLAACIRSHAAEVTFNRDVAPIIWKQCAPCHRAGQAAPFALITYDEVRSKGRQILKAIQENYMPPWLPEAGYGQFQNERRLTPKEKQIIEQWVAGGSVEGEANDRPQAPVWESGWLLGKPDLVVTMPKPFEVGPEGPDIYRNFAIPIEMDRDRSVRAIEFRPGNPAIVHHAFIKVDGRATSRTLDGRDGAPGFNGMNVPAEMPAGQFLTWQPGKLPAPAPENLAWLLPKTSDLVLQAHLNRTGKPETLQSSIGLYFTEKAPTNYAFKFALMSLKLHFPPGASNTVVADSFTLPVAVEALAVLPHAHHLARGVEGYAILPAGKKEWLIRIKDWDFRWQGDYRYVQPLKFTAGTKLHLQITYDNSTNNLRNPNNPPKLVEYGAQSLDEMCELWLQLLASSERDLATLKEASDNHKRQMFMDYFNARLQWYPNDPLALTKLGSKLVGERKYAQAQSNFKKALETNPNFAEAHYELGVLYRMTKRRGEAKRALETALRLNPENSKAWGHLGFLWAEMGNARECESCFRKALEIDPADEIVRSSLEELLSKTR